MCVTELEKKEVFLGVSTTKRKEGVICRHHLFRFDHDWLKCQVFHQRSSSLLNEIRTIQSSGVLGNGVHNILLAVGWRCTVARSAGLNGAATTRNNTNIAR